MIEKKHIFITGFMGCGKSALAAHLAKLLNRPALDMDREIERRFKMPIKDIFAQHGQAAFRRAETGLLRKIAACARPQVVACGGGSVLDEENRRLMDNSGSRVFLRVGLPVIRQRLACEDKASRPLWQDESRVEQLFSQRMPIYESAGKQVNGEKPVAAIAARLASSIFQPMQASLKAMGVECVLQTVWPDSREELGQPVAGHRHLLLLDGALREQAASWQQAGFQVRVIRRRGESLKTLNQAQKILQTMLECRLARDDYLIVRGGGSLTDMGAFCAGLYKRGLNLVLIATTLLAAVDAAVGGKTALNFNGVKNQLGHFYLPQKVIIDIASFASLKPAQLADGLVEAYKTGLIGDEALSGFIEDNLDILKNGDLPYLAWVAGRAMQIKAGLVQNDFREQLGVRDVLNLGHTFGHVVESGCNYKISHGRAVAAGLLVAIQLSRQKTGLAASDAQRLTHTIKRLCKMPGLPPREAVREIIEQDKKYRAGKMGFILLQKPGQAVLTHNLELDDVLNAAYGEGQ